MPRAGAVGQGLELLRVREGVAEPPQRKAAREAPPSQRSQRRRARDGAVEEGERLERVGRQLGRHGPGQRGERRHRLGVRSRAQRGHGAGHVPRGGGELAGEKPEVDRTGRVFQRASGRVDATADDAIEIGDARAELRVPGGALERVQIEDPCPL